MRQLNTQEISSVTGASKLTDAIAAVTAALAAKGITYSFDKAANTLTVVTPQGTKTFKLPTLPQITVKA